MKPTISISFLNHVLFPQNADHHLRFGLLEHAGQLSLTIALRKPPFIRAAEELKMLSKTDLERERYEARRKLQIDYNTGIKAARLEGIEEGIEKGIKKGRIQEKIDGIRFCEQLLQRQETPAEALASLPIDALDKIAQELRAQILKQRNA